MGGGFLEFSHVGEVVDSFGVYLTFHITIFINWAILKHAIKMKRNKIWTQSKKSELLMNHSTLNSLLILEMGQITVGRLQGAVVGLSHVKLR